ncbi:MAG: ATP phosphoribosyltransferase regulatory subunit [Alphaproteobacteria bacterium]|nr:MAG: ATP phosphoribosyltransferase regulatory subunit [Alphaproteobacteria bacterium]
MRNAAPDAQAEALLASFERTGFARAAPAILQPAEPFLDLSGEDIRKRMYLTTDPQGQELCLRPDLTIPVSRDYLASPAAGKPQGFCYLGPVFRHRGDAPGEFLQAGVESFGRLDTPAADAEMLALGLEATAHYGLAAPDVRMGDIGLFSALVAALDLAPAWKRRLIKDFNHKSSLVQDLDRLAVSTTRAKSEYQGVLSALAGSDPQAARALVTDLLSIAGITAVGGRSVGEIAERFLEQAAVAAQSSLPPDIRVLIEKFLAVTGDLGHVASALRSLARDAKIKLDAALDLLEARTDCFAARGVKAGSIRFSTAFGRGLDYYSGFVFELHDGASRQSGPLVAGGRYDGLLTRLGSTKPIPAVGFAAWIDRLSALPEGS